MRASRNLSLALSLIAAVAGMIMLASASVPLYRLFCQTTGFGGIAQKSNTAVQATLERIVTVRFDANVSQGLNWSFKPAQKEVRVKLGEEKTVEYIAQNRGDSASTGTATFNVLPVKAGGYFDKMECFCFSEQTLGPKEIRRLGLRFFIDPQMAQNHALDDTSTITLSYTFFRVEKRR